MIKNINDLKRMMAEDAKDFDEEIYKKSFLLGGPGISKESLMELQEKCPALPNSYLKWLSELNLLDVQVGYFSIAPINYEAKDVGESLVRAQTKQESFIPRAILDQYGLYWIGNNNDYTLYVAGIGSKFKEGSIHVISEEIFNAELHEYDKYIVPLAVSFEEFLVIAGNLNEIHKLINQMPSQIEKHHKEFWERLEKLNVSKGYYKSWEIFL